MSEDGLSIRAADR